MKKALLKVLSFLCHGLLVLIASFALSSLLLFTPGDSPRHVRQGIVGALVAIPLVAFFIVPSAQRDSTFGESDVASQASDWFDLDLLRYPATFLLWGAISYFLKNTSARLLRLWIRPPLSSDMPASRVQAMIISLLAVIAGPVFAASLLLLIALYFPGHHNSVSHYMENGEIKLHRIGAILPPPR